MSTSITVESTPTLEKLKESFKNAEKKLKDRRDVNAELGIMLSGWVLRNFATEGGKVGGWAKLKAGGRWVTTRKGKRYLDRSAKILQNTGRLRSSFIPFSNLRGTGIGSALPYSKPHNEGDTSRDLPQRRMLPRSSEVRRDIRAVYVKSIAKMQKEMAKELKR